eukprot:jgi/Mesvir1/15483/Mv20019-RA.2
MTTQNSMPMAAHMALGTRAWGVASCNKIVNSSQRGCTSVLNGFGAARVKMSPIARSSSGLHGRTRPMGGRLPGELSIVQGIPAKLGSNTQRSRRTAHRGVPSPTICNLFSSESPSSRLITSYPSSEGNMRPYVPFVFHLPNNARAMVLVEEHQSGDCFQLRLNFVGLSIGGEAFLHWGCYRSSREEWDFPDRSQWPARTGLSPDSSALRTAMRQLDNGAYEVTLTVPCSMAPLSLSCVIYQPGGKDGKETWIGRKEGGNICVPLGMLAGSPYPLGVSVTPSGAVNFALFSRAATHVKLCLHDPGQAEPYMEIDLDPATHRTGDIWHVCLSNRDALNGKVYGYRVAGDLSWETGSRFHASNVMLDPYAKVLSAPIKDPKGKKRPRYLGYLDFYEPAFDWQGDAPPAIPQDCMVGYEMHVQHFTAHESSGVTASHRGTFLGLVDKIDHLVDLGINTVILYPVAAFGMGPNQPRDYKGFHPALSFFAPTQAYTSDKMDPLAARRELKTAVRELHKRGIEVILDVVYSQTCEGTDKNPWPISFRGIDNATYYVTDASGETAVHYGGNAVNFAHPVVQELVLDSLRHWVEEYHVDGFVFAHAPTMLRGADGRVGSLPPPLVEAIAFDAVLGGLKLIADPIQHDGTYEEDAFPHWGRWLERNTKFRTDVRCFVRGDMSMLSGLATRLSGSADLFSDLRGPIHGVNFVASRDGLTLADVVSYSRACVIGEQAQRVAKAHNQWTDISWNGGEEGPSGDPHIAAMRCRQVRNIVLALCLSQGTPVLSMGDEYGHSTQGLVRSSGESEHFFRWDMLRAGGNASLDPHLVHFTSMAVDFRKSRLRLLQRSRMLLSEDLTWHGAQGNGPRWNEPDSKVLGVSFHSRPEDGTMGPGGEGDVFVIFNSHEYPMPLRLPEPPAGMTWMRLVDTSMMGPDNFDYESQPLQSL